MSSLEIKAYVKACDICLTLKTIMHKPYNNFQSLLYLIYCWKNISIDFVTGLPGRFWQTGKEIITIPFLSLSTGLLKWYTSS